MRGLMAAIVIMGVLLVAGTVALGFGIYKKMNSAKNPAPSQMVSGETVINLPEDSHIKEVLTDERRIIVHTTTDQNIDRLYILKSSNGEHTGTVVFKTNAPVQDTN